MSVSQALFYISLWYVIFKEYDISCDVSLIYHVIYKIPGTSYIIWYIEHHIYHWYLTYVSLLCKTFSTMFTLSHQYLLVVGACAVLVKHWLGTWPSVPATYTIFMNDTANAPAPRGHTYMACICMCGVMQTAVLLQNRHHENVYLVCCTHWR